jgi:hypothetical protein
MNTAIDWPMRAAWITGYLKAIARDVDIDRPEDTRKHIERAGRLLVASPEEFDREVYRCCSSPDLRSTPAGTSADGTTFQRIHCDHCHTSRVEEL